MTAPDRDPVTLAHDAARLARDVLEADALIWYVTQASRDDFGVSLKEQFEAEDDERFLQEAATPLARAVIALTAERDAYREENSRLREKIARMEELAERYEVTMREEGGPGGNKARADAYAVHLARIRAALNGGDHA